MNELQMKNDEIKERLRKLKDGEQLSREEQILILEKLLRANRRILELRVRVGDYVTAKSMEAAEQER